MPVRTPKLDFSFLDQRSLIYQDRINRSRLLGDIAQGVIGAVQEGARYKRAQEIKSQAELAEAMAFDTNITGDHIIDTKLTQWYNDYLKEPGTALLYDKKGKITGVDKIALKTKQKEFMRIANFWKNEFLADVNNAKKTSFSSQNQGLYDYDGDEIQRVYDDLMNDRLNLADGPAYYNKIYADKYDTGQYFVSMRPIDPSVTVEKILAEFQKATKRPIGKRTVVVEKDGKKYTTSVDDYEYGTADEFIEFAKSSIASDRDRGAWMVKGIGLALSPDEQMKAMELYPEKEITEVFNDYFWDQKVRPKAEKILNPKPIVDTRVEPVSSTGKSKTIPMVDGSWDIRGNPQKFTGSEKEVYDSKGNRVNLTEKTAYITELKYGKIPGSKNTGLYVAMIISKKGGAYDDLIKRKQSGEIVGRDEWMAAYLNQSEKSQEVYIPYNKVKNVLKDYTFEGIDEFTLEKGDPLGIL